jgi:isoaspartyl peptidase/L-asparaginase-like protein (Ntn-hydrolase superfamily)
MIERVPGAERYQVGVLAMDHRGRVGAFSVQQGFTYALADGARNTVPAASAALQIDGDIERAKRVKGEG